MNKKSILYAICLVIAASCVYRQPIFMAINLPVACIALIAFAALKRQSQQLLIADRSPKRLAILSSALFIVCILLIIPPLVQFYGLRALSDPAFFLPFLAILGFELIDLRHHCKET